MKKLCLLASCRRRKLLAGFELGLASEGKNGQQDEVPDALHQFHAVD